MLFFRPVSASTRPPRLTLSLCLCVSLGVLSRRHVVLPADISKALPKNGRLLSEIEWRALGVQQSRGWIHYAIHKPEPHIMLFRRPLNYQQQQQAAQRASVAAR